MCSTTGTGHFANLIQKTTGSCSKPARSSTVESIRASQRADNIIAEGNLRDREMQSVGEPADRESLLQRIRAMEGLLNQTFCSISTLKNAYVQLQAAHVPYDAEKLQTADRAVIKEMKRLSELKRFYKKICRQSAADSGVEDLAPKKGSEIETLRDVLENAKKGSEFETPEDVVETARSTERGSPERKPKRHNKNDIIENFRHNNAVRVRDNVIYSRRPSSGIPTVKLFEATVQKMKESARAFTKCLICLMKSAGWDLDAAAKSIEPGIRYAKHCHKKFAFRSYVCLRMFEGFEMQNQNFCSAGSLTTSEDRRNECFREFQAMAQAEPTQLLSVTPDCPFGKFCLKKFLHIVHPKMEESFFGGFEHRNLIVSGGHPRSQFYGAFLQFAKCAWLVHRLAFSFDPAISIFHAQRGADFHDSYMENLNNVAVPDGGNPVARFVGFTVMPGFRFGDRALVRCQVYLADDAIRA